MNMDTNHLISHRTLNLGSNIIREILKVVSQPGMVSLAGGIPAPESFPMHILTEVSETVIKKYSSRAFQYDQTEGFPPLREVLSEYLSVMRGISAKPEDVLIASGSQGALDAVGKVLINPGDKVAVEAPTYLGAIQAFTPYEPEYISLETDGDGVIPEFLEQVLRTQRIKFIYLVPTFQNPTGKTIPLNRRKEIADIVQKHRTLLVEDDPYSLLRYEGDDLPPIKTLAPEQTIYISTLSKVFAPGLRIGFFVSPKWIQKWFVLVKQGTDLHTSTFNQALATEYLSSRYLKAHLPRIIEIYRPKQQAMLDALEKYFPEDFRWSRPQGGMFLWAEGPKGMDMEKVFWNTVKRKVAFVPGKYFYTEKDAGQETMRLNFTMADEDTIDRSIKTISEVIKEEEKDSSNRMTG
jgi:2-aminoadipate transaminase